MRGIGFIFILCYLVFALSTHEVEVFDDCKGEIGFRAGFSKLDCHKYQDSPSDFCNSAIPVLRLSIPGSDINAIYNLNISLWQVCPVTMYTICGKSDDLRPPLCKWVCPTTEEAINITISNNPSIKHIICPNLTHAANALSINNDVSLRKVIFGQLKSVTDFVGIMNNPKLSEVQFPLTTTIGGALGIKNNPKLSEVQFPLTTRIGGALQIKSNINLSEVHFPLTTNIGGELQVEGNTALRKINLMHLENLSSSLDISGNGQLEQANFPNMVYIMESLYIRQNKRLRQLNFTSLKYIYHDVDIYYNIKIKQVYFRSLQYVGGQLYIWWNDALQDVDFPHLINAYTLKVKYNYALRVVSFPLLSKVEDVEISNKSLCQEISGSHSPRYGFVMSLMLIPPILVSVFIFAALICCKRWILIEDIYFSNEKQYSIGQCVFRTQYRRVCCKEHVMFSPIYSFLILDGSRGKAFLLFVMSLQLYFILGNDAFLTTPSGNVTDYTEYWYHHMFFLIIPITITTLLAVLFPRRSSSSLAFGINNYNSERVVKLRNLYRILWYTSGGIGMVALSMIMINIYAKIQVGNKCVPLYHRKIALLLLENGGPVAGLDILVLQPIKILVIILQDKINGSQVFNEYVRVGSMAYKWSLCKNAIYICTWIIMVGLSIFLYSTVKVKTQTMAPAVLFYMLCVCILTCLHRRVTFNFVRTTEVLRPNGTYATYIRQCSNRDVVDIFPVVKTYILDKIRPTQLMENKQNECYHVLCDETETKKSTSEKPKSSRPLYINTEQNKVFGERKYQQDRKNVFLVSNEMINRAPSSIN